MTNDLPGELFRWIVEAMPEAVVFVRDVTTRWEQEQALRKRLARLEATDR